MIAPVHKWQQHVSQVQLFICLCNRTSPLAAGRTTLPFSGGLGFCRIDMFVHFDRKHSQVAATCITTSLFSCSFSRTSPLAAGRKTLPFSGGLGFCHIDMFVHFDRNHSQVATTSNTIPVVFLFVQSDVPIRPRKDNFTVFWGSWVLPYRFDLAFK